MWEDTKFDLKLENIEQLAIVGDKKWKKGMAMFCKPFTSAKIKYFDHGRVGEGAEWIEE